MVQKMRKPEDLCIGQLDDSELEARNAAYLAKLERSYEQLQKGEVVTLSMEQLEKLAEE